MSNVASIFGKDKTTAADCQDVATDLVELAEKLRSGERNAVRGVIIYQRPDGCISHVAVGEPISKLECVGLCAWAMENIKNG